MTFSIVGRDGSSLGVAVASKFLAAGAMVPAASAGAGAVATQAYANLALKTEGLALLADGLAAPEVLARFFAGDPDAAQRQAGIVDATGRSATFTGESCQAWAGGTARTDVAAQGNMLAGPEVVEAMLTTWDASPGPLAERLLGALAAGQAAGGDPRGKQAAALLVVAPGAGYGGLSDVAVDLRVDDHPEPIGELVRMLALHQLYFGTTPDTELIALDDLAVELAERLATQGYATGDVSRDLYGWMGRENFEERWHDGRIDPVVLEQLRLARRVRSVPARHARAPDVWLSGGLHPTKDQTSLRVAGQRVRASSRSRTMSAASRNGTAGNAGRSSRIRRRAARQVGHRASPTRLLHDAHTRSSDTPPSLR